MASLNNYVRFQRGSLKAYQKLISANKINNDTLYFIYEDTENNTQSALYLGTELISGGELNLNKNSSINDLKDVILSQTENKQILCYNEEKQIWENKTLQDIISEASNFIGATETFSGAQGLVPAPEKGQLNSFLRSDGTWAPLSFSGSISASDVGDLDEYLSEKGYLKSSSSNFVNLIDTVSDLDKIINGKSATVNSPAVIGLITKVDQLQTTVGDITTLSNYDINNPTTIVKELEKIQNYYTWLSIS